MNMTNRLEIRKIAELRPYENNARVHSPEQIDRLRASLRAYGFVRPLLINAEGMVLAGHGILEAAKAEGLTEAPCVPVEHLSAEEARAYILADNRLAELSAWDEEIVSGELTALRDAGFGLDLTGFDAADLQLDGEEGHFWEVDAEPTEAYDAFMDKFRPKLTTDDCYTPANVYAAVRDWTVARYGLQGAEILRPFYPGGDYQAAEYAEGSVVIDNPPFSILSEICAWYDEHGIRYFLFCPGMTTFSVNAGRCNYLPCGVSVMFDNGAEISISFLTNLGDAKIELAPDLYAAVEAANKINLAKVKASLPVYEYPDAVVSVAINKLTKYGQALRISADDAVFIRALDSQKEQGKTIYGGGFLLSGSAAAEKAAAEKAAALRWPLSSREQTLIASMGCCHE